ncbi:hypothetical protein SB778_31995 [Paraburkholderia sp. SIMBA_050]|nr:hypothetical protein B2G74_00410 [Burkholderia sp. A27]
MELATKRNKANVKMDLRALVNGMYSGDPSKLIDKLAQDLLYSASESLAPDLQRAFVSNKSVYRAFAHELKVLLVRDDADESREKTLSADKLSPDEVLARTGMSKTTLYRADHVKFYSVIPAGMQKRRAFPAWQFQGDVPSHLPRVLAILSRKSRIQVNTFFVSEQDALNELTPAEMMAGLPFEDRLDLAPEQSRMLAMPEEKRLDMVIALATMEVADTD